MHQVDSKTTVLDHADAVRWSTLQVITKTTALQRIERYSGTRQNTKDRTANSQNPTQLKDGKETSKRKQVCVKKLCCYIKAYMSGV
jgi:hypothetical protein